MNIFWFLVSLFAVWPVIYSGMDSGFGRFEIWLPLLVILIGDAILIYQSDRNKYTNDSGAVLRAKQGLFKALVYGLVAGVVIAGLLYFLLK